MINKDASYETPTKKEKQTIVYQLTEEQAKFINKSGLFPNGYSLQFLSHRQTRLRLNPNMPKYIIDPLLAPIKKQNKTQKLDSKVNIQSIKNIQNQSRIEITKNKYANTEMYKGKQKINELNNQTQNAIAQQMKKCEKILNKVYKFECSWPFRQPVDVKSLNIPKYFQIIKKPMDLKTIQFKLKNGEYKSAASFNRDMELIFQNSYKFNKKSSIYYENTVDCQQFYMNTLKKQFNSSQLNKEEPKLQEVKPKISRQRIIALIEQIKKINKSQKLGQILQIVYENQLTDDNTQHQIDLMKLPAQKIIAIQNLFHNQFNRNKKQAIRKKKQVE